MFFRIAHDRTVARSLAPLLLLALMSLGGIRPAGAQEEEAAALLERAAGTMAALDSFHFQLSTPRGQTVFLEGLELAALDGDVQRPDRFRASATARAAIVELSVEVIGIGTKLWVTNPTQEGQQFQEFDTFGMTGEGNASLVDLLNPDRVLLRAVSLVEEPTVAGEDDIDGVPTTRVDGTFDLSRLQDLATPASGPRDDGTPDAGLGADVTPFAGLLTDRSLPVSIWIDEEGRVRRLELEGPLTAAEMPDVVRRLDLTGFDEATEIEPPV